MNTSNSTLAALVSASLTVTSGLALGQSVDREIDTNLLSQKVLKVDCDLQTLAKANDCIRRVVPTLQYRSAFYSTQLATFMVKVQYSKMLSEGKPTFSVGTGFLVDSERGYVITAKHVILGQKVWSTLVNLKSEFGDLDSAIEDYVYMPENVQITLQPFQDATPVSASLVAIDRNSDLALLAVRNINALPTSNFPALFRAIPLAPRVDCNGSVAVTTIGFSATGEPDKFDLSITKPASATCDVLPQTYEIGGTKNRVALYRTDAPFRPGFSGGPVLDASLNLVGVVSGASVGGGDRRFFVPLPSINAFLNRFR